MNIFDTRNLVNFELINNLSRDLIIKNGRSFQSFINVEENSELIVELLVGKSKKNTASEIADVLITTQHIINAFGLEQAVNNEIEKNKNKQIDDIKLAAYLAQFNKEIIKNLNRDQSNRDNIAEYAALVTMGLLCHIQKNKNIEIVNAEISKKIERTKKRNDLANFSSQSLKVKDWDEIFLLMAFAMASGSHCVSRQVGALLVKRKRIISTGINGTPEGCKNCDDIFPSKYEPEFNRVQHHEFSTKNEIHAEMNALLYKAREGGGYDLNGATLYCTMQPCDDCLKNILQSGVKRVVYAEKYDLSNYSDFILNAIKQKEIELIHKPLYNTARSFVFLQNSMIKGTQTTENPPNS